MALQLEDPFIRPGVRIHNLSLPSPAPRTSSLANSSIHIDFPSCPSERAEMAGAHPPPSTYHSVGSGYTSYGHGKVVEELKKPKHSLLQNPNSPQELLDQDLYTQERCYYNRRRFCCQKEYSSGKTCVAEEEEKLRAEQKGAGEDFPEADEGTEGRGGGGADTGVAQYFDQHDNGNAKGEIGQHEFGGEDEADMYDTKTLTRKEKGHIKIRLKLSAHTPSSLEEDLGDMSRSQKKAKLMEQTLNRRALSCALRRNPKQSQVLTDTDFEHIERKGSQNAPKRDQGGSPSQDNTNILPRHHVCSTCARAFQSLKALHGHMRCHNSEKSWIKGTSLPVLGISSKETFVPQSNKLQGGKHKYLAVVHDSLVDQRSSATLAGLEDQLGALGTHGIDTDFPTEVEKDKMKKPTFTHTVSKREMWPHSFSCLPQKRSAPMNSREDASGNNLTDEPHQTILEERFGNTNSDVIEAALALYMIATTTYPAPLPSSSKVWLKLKGIELHEQTKEETTAHPCKLCDKVFSSPQALGGHISARHKKPSLIFKPKEKRISSYIERQQHDEGAEEHKCTTCNMSFTSGQALGGHKRAHWSGTDKATNDYKQVQLPHQDEQMKIATKSMNVRLDLDLPAPLEDEGEYGYGHESSFAGPMELEERHDYGYADHIGCPSLSLEKLTTKQTTSDYTQSAANYAIDNIGLDSSKITCNAVEDLGLKCTIKGAASRGVDRRQLLLKLQAQKPIVLAH